MSREVPERILTLVNQEYHWWHYAFALIGHNYDAFGYITGVKYQKVSWWLVKIFKIN